HAVPLRYRRQPTVSPMVPPNNAHLAAQEARLAGQPSPPALHLSTESALLHSDEQQSGCRQHTRRPFGTKVTPE
ncbi:hypothetical protein, partial [Chloroflexus aurantiacus]